MDATSLGTRIRDARISAGLTRHRDLSALLDVDAARISEWESGRVTPRAETIAAIARLCGCSTDYLLGLEAA